MPSIALLKQMKFATFLSTIREKNSQAAWMLTMVGNHGVTQMHHPRSGTTVIPQNVHLKKVKDLLFECEAKS